MTDKKCDYCAHKTAHTVGVIKVAMCARKRYGISVSCHTERTGGGWRHCGSDAKYFKAAD
jgi:hypothetical protein